MLAYAGLATTPSALNWPHASEVFFHPNYVAHLEPVQTPGTPVRLPDSHRRNFGTSSSIIQIAAHPER